MARRAIHWIKRRPLLTAFGFAFACLAVWAISWSTYTWVAWTSLLADVGAIDSVAESSHKVETSWSFAFQSATCTVEVSIDSGELDRARRIDTSRAFGAPVRLRADYLPRLVRSQAESRFISQLAEEFRRIREEMALDDDEYLELIAAAVQVIPYGEPKGDILLPIEVVADEEGVCSEKSVLLAALLVHEGYATAVWALPTQRHVAVGVRSDAAHFNDSDYMFIETTRPAFVGYVDPQNRARGPIARPPVLMPVSDGKAYTSGWQIEYILMRMSGSLTPIEHNLRAYPAFRTPGTYWALQAAEEEATTRLGDFALANTHDRELVYRTFIASGALAIGY